MQLQELIQGIAPIGVEGSLDREVSGIACDSRRVFPGMMFVAVPGRRTDGHDFICSAIDRGACAVVAQRNGFVSPRVTQIQVADTRSALAWAAAAFYGHPSRRLVTVGVTGSQGRTAVSFLARHLLAAAGRQCGLLGAVHYEIGDRIIPAQRTLLEAVDAQRMMAQMVRAGCGACVLEAGAQALAERRVDAVAFDVGVFTDLTHDPLAESEEAIHCFAAKRRLFGFLGEGGKPGTAVVNVDDWYGLQLVREIQAGQVLSYGLSESAQIRAGRVRLGPEGTDLRVETPRGGFDCRIPVLGRFHVYHALAAVGVALAQEIPLPIIEAGLRRLPQVPGWFERVFGGQPCGVFVDYVRTAEGLSQALSALREITAGRLLLTFGCVGDGDVATRQAMGEVAGSLADLTLVTSDNPRHESPAGIAGQIGAGLRRVNRGSWRMELDRTRAIDEILRVAQPGDSVLIAGKGHEAYQEHAGTVVPFDDRARAKEVLETLGWSRGRWQGR